MSFQSTAAISNKKAFLDRLFKVMQFQHQYPGFLEAKGLEIVQSEIIAPMHKKMKLADYSQKIIDSTKIQDFKILDNGEMEFTIVSELIVDGNFDAAEAREKGTRRWFNKPVKKLALSWVAASIRFFSKGHWMPARPGTHIVQDTIAEKLAIAQAKLDQETDEMLSKILKS